VLDPRPVRADTRVVWCNPPAPVRRPCPRRTWRASRRASRPPIRTAAAPTTH